MFLVFSGWNSTILGFNDLIVKQITIVIPNGRRIAATIEMKKQQQRYNVKTILFLRDNIYVITWNYYVISWLLSRYNVKLSFFRDNFHFFPHFFF